MSAQLQANRQTPAQWALIGLGILAAGLFLAVPLVFIFIQAFQKGIAPVLENLVHPESDSCRCAHGLHCAHHGDGQHDLRRDARLGCHAVLVSRENGAPLVHRHPVCGFSGGGRSYLSALVRCEWSFGALARCGTGPDPLCLAGYGARHEFLSPVLSWPAN